MFPPIFDVVDLKEQLLELEGNNNVVIYDVNSTFFYNYNMNNLYHDIKVMPIYLNKSLIGGIYIKINKKKRFVVNYSVIYLRHYKEYIENYIEINFKSANCYIMLPCDLNIKLPRINHNTKTVIIYIEDDDEKQIKKFTKGRRGSLKKSFKENLLFRELSSIEEYKQMLNILEIQSKRNNYRISETNMELLNMYYYELRPISMVKAFGVFKNNDLIAADLIMIAGARARAQIIAEKYLGDSNAQTFLMYNILNFLRNKGIKSLDLSGYADNNSYLSGVGFFKKSLGGHVENHCEYDTSILQRRILNFKRSNIVQKLYGIYKQRKL